MDLSLSSRPWYLQLGAFVVLAAGAGAGFWKVYVTGLQADIQIRRTRLVAVRSDLAKGLGPAGRLHGLQAHVSDLEHRLDSLTAVLPEQKDVADILRRVPGLATQSHLTVQRFTPQPPKAQALHIELPYKLHAEGTYHNLGAFLDRISKSQLLIHVPEISIKATPQQQPNASIVAEYVASTVVVQEGKGQKSPTAMQTAPPAYSYQMEGRRDPFAALIGAGTEPNPSASRPSGLPGVLIGELTVKGIMRDRTGFLAMLQGPDKRTYAVRSGEKLLDGSVKSVTADGIAFLQDVSDPLLVVKQREVVKKLRATDGGGK